MTKFSKSPRYKLSRAKGGVRRWKSKFKSSRVGGIVGRKRSKDSWRELRKDYPSVSTPTTLVTSLKAGVKKGYYFKYGYSISYAVVSEDKFMWVVSTEKIHPSGVSAGGHYYVSKKNPKRAVFD